MIVQLSQHREIVCLLTLFAQFGAPKYEWSMHAITISSNTTIMIFMVCWVCVGTTVKRHLTFFVLQQAQCTTFRVILLISRFFEQRGIFRGRIESRTSLLLGSTVVSPYVGMARKQNGGYNASISVQTPIFHLVVNSTRLKTVRSARWCCPNSTMAPRLLENVVKVTNLEVVKIDFRHLPFLPSFFLSFFSQPSALTRAVPRTKRPWIPVKFLEDVPFELSF